MLLISLIPTITLADCWILALERVFHVRRPWSHRLSIPLTLFTVILWNNYCDVGRVSSFVASYGELALSRYPALLHVYASAKLLSINSCLANVQTWHESTFKYLAEIFLFSCRISINCSALFIDIAELLVRVVKLAALWTSHTVVLMWFSIYMTYLHSQIS